VPWPIRTILKEASQHDQRQPGWLDAVTQDLLITNSGALEKHAWMLGASR